MAILNIISNRTSDGEKLRKKSRFVTEINGRIIQLLDDMRDTLVESGGVGLAAPQVGVLRRIVLINTGEEIIECINPEIIKTEGEQEGLEGCLSCPDQWAITKRPMTATIKAIDRFGNEFTATDSGLIARCFCHEVDHLEGVLFLDNIIRMVDEEELEEMKNKNE